VDTASRNGTFLDGRTVSSVRLEREMELRLGF
jgi:hypothetical protein